MGKCRLVDRVACDLHAETLLAPTLPKGVTVILDNLAVRKSDRAARCLAERGARFLFLPPYSPDLNPIEMRFAELKAYHQTSDAPESLQSVVPPYSRELEFPAPGVPYCVPSRSLQARER